MEGPDNLLACGNKVILRDKNTGALAWLEKFIQFYQPAVLVLPDVQAKDTRRATRIKTLHKQMVAWAVTAKDEWKTLIYVAYYIGARLGDCCRTAWADVDLSEGTLAYTQSKTGEKVTVPLHTDLLAHLEKLAGTDKPEVFIMPRMAHLQSGGRHGLSEQFKSIMRKAGIDSGKVQGGGVRKLSRRTFHALRHSFTSALANKGVTRELRMKLTGHKTEAEHQKYTHHELATLRDAVEKIPSLH
ncbi:MAG: hypothetical protein RLZZ350_1979 [Verrucomicrobiota bacterium]